jgi:hypothetical protein
MQCDTLTEAERRAVAAADEWLKHNEPIPHEQVLAEFGLTMEEWDQMAEEPESGDLASLQRRECSRRE